ncbi:MAG: DUF924 family protein [Paracoccaceae bacterium]
MLGPKDVIAFWLDEVGPERWYASDEALDARIRERFGGLWEKARAGGLHDWLTSPRGMLAYLILTDQFPRNMFRGEARAFATDARARAEAKLAIDHGFDMRVPEPERQFFYLPLIHSECLTDQDRCVRLMLTRMPETGAANLLHAKAHREVIRRFGRFPFRNEALSRNSSAEERSFVAEGGYGRTVERLRA